MPIITGTDTIQSTTAANNSASNSMMRTVQEELGKDDFLKILAAELQNQDPTNPVDDKDFIAQLAQFSSLEQMQNMAVGFNVLNKTLNDYVQEQSKLGSSLNILQSASLIGKVVRAEVGGQIVEGKVEAVRIKDSIPYAMIAGEKVDINQIKEVYEVNEVSGINEVTPGSGNNGAEGQS